MSTTTNALNLVPQGGSLLESATLVEAFQRTARAHSEKPALRSSNQEDSMTWGEYAERVESIARGLAAAGVKRGDTVALMMLNRPEFNLCDSAAMHLGATPFSVYNTLAPEQIAHLFRNAGNRIVICESQFLENLLEAAEAPGVETIVCVDGEPDGTVSLGALAAGGDDGLDFEGAWRAVEPDDLVTLIYTSGTTGPPKGVELTHENMMAQARGVQPVLPQAPGGRVLSYLPSAHLADRWMSHYNAIVFGHELISLSDSKQLAAALPDARPTYFAAVPRVWEKLQSAIEAQGVPDPGGVPDEVRRSIRAKLGLDEARWVICGAAPVPVEVLEFFSKLGIEISEAWGMSEISCIGTVNPPGALRPGSVGKVIPNCEVRLAEDGELLFRGPTRMRGYRNDPERTAEAFDEYGSMKTGDIAEIDNDGYVRIIDRKKELIINSAGKNMSPANIEQRIKASSPLIGQAIAIGDNRSFVTALIVLDPDVATVWANANGVEGRSIAEIAADAQTLAEVQRGIDEANRRLSRVEEVKRFRVLPCDWEPGGDELTPTMKLKRKPIHAKYEQEIEALYRVTGGK